MVTLLGFASGLPLALTGQAMQAWLTVDGIDLSTIGFFALVGLPYTFKFLWAPLIDRFDIPGFSRRRGWLLMIQLAMAGVLVLLSLTTPKNEMMIFALYAVILSFLSASQDVVIDAYRTDLLAAPERGLGASLSVLGYRLAMIFSGGIALIWADPIQGGKTWNEIYFIMAMVMLVMSLVTVFALPTLQTHVKQFEGSARRDIFGFLSILLIAVLGYVLTSYVLNPMASQMTSAWFDPTGLTLNAAQKLSTAHQRWSNVAGLLMGLGLTLPVAWLAMRRLGFSTLNAALDDYLKHQRALWLLLFIVLYKLGDAFAGSLLTPFLLSGMGFGQAEVGVVNKILGIWLTIIGAIVGGTLMMRLGLYRALLYFGILQLVSNIGFYVIAISSKGAWGSIVLPAFNLGIVQLKTATTVDMLLLSAISFENISGGMGTAAFVAFLMALCNARFTATQYALLSAFASVGRVWVSPLAGVIAESAGWPTFFINSLFFGAPGIVLLYYLRNAIGRLDTRHS